MVYISRINRSLVTSSAGAGQEAGAGAGAEGKPSKEGIGREGSAHGLDLGFMVEAVVREQLRAALKGPQVQLVVEEAVAEVEERLGRRLQRLEGEVQVAR